MITKTTIAAALISLTTLAAVPAQASDINIRIGFGSSGYGWSDGHGHGHGQYYHRMRRLSTDEVRWMLRNHGYHHINVFDNLFKVNADNTLFATNVFKYLADL